MPNEHHGGELDCRAAVLQLWDYLDEELTEARMTLVRQHLEGCAACLPHLDFGRAFLDAVGQTRAEERCPPKVRARVMERLREAGFSTP